MLGKAFAGCRTGTHLAEVWGFGLQLSPASAESGRIHPLCAEPAAGCVGGDVPGPQQAEGSGLFRS